MADTAGDSRRHWQALKHYATTPVPTAERWYQDKRIDGLARFVFAITFLNILGHLWLGFEQSKITPLVSLAAAYGTEIALELVAAREAKRAPRFLGEGFLGLVKFLLSAHVSALAIGMLLMPLEQLWVVAFASSAAIASKHLFRIAIDRRTRHFLNPSNFGITLALLLFPSVGIAPPYQFSEATSGALDWLLPFVIICTGSLLNTKFTWRIPLIAAWLGAFAVQAIIRSALNETPVAAALVPMTGFAFVLFTFYMITDPATSPSKRGNQIAFGVAVAAFYMLFLELHIVFGMFYALTLVTVMRGLWFAFDMPLRVAGIRASVARSAAAPAQGAEGKRKIEPAE